MSKATLTSKGQITIPLAVRQRLAIDTGDKIEFVEAASGEFTIKPVTGDVRSLKGLLNEPVQPVSTEKMRAAIRKQSLKNKPSQNKT